MRITRTELRLAARAAIFRQGEKLFNQGAVKVFAHDDRMVRGAVHDYIDRKVTVRQQANSQLSSSCTCYTFEAPCAHVIALLLAHLGEEEARTRPAHERPSWESYLQNLQQLQAHNTNTPAVKAHRVIFFIELRPSRWTLRPLRVYIKKSGELGHRAPMHFNLQVEYNHHEAAPVEERAINYLLQRQRVEKHRYHHSFYSYETISEFDFEYGEEIGYILDLLADSELYLHNGSDAQPKLRMVSSSSKLAFRLEQEVTATGPEMYRFFPELQRGDRRDAVNESYRVLASRPFWLLREDTLYRVESSLPAAFALPFTAPSYRVQIPADQIGGFLKGFSPHLKHNLEISLPENFVLQTARELAARRLYMVEHERSLRLELKFVYGEVEVASTAAQEMDVASNGSSNILWRVDRDHAAETAARDALLAAGLKLDDSSGLYSPRQEPVLWVFEELPKLAAAGFEIFGEESLKHHRVNRALPNVRLAVSSGIDWFDLNMEIDFGGVLLSVTELRQALKQQNRFVKLADGSLARVPEEWEKRFRHFFNFAQINAGRAQVASAHALLIDALFDTAHDKRYDEEFREHLEKLSDFKGIQEVAVPRSFRGELRPYQRAGLSWLAFLHNYGLNGCLADDMGLGKTIQALACLLREKEMNGVHAKSKRKKANSEIESGAGSDSSPAAGRHTSLIVAPLSVLFNWENERARFAPDLNMFVHHGLERERSTVHFCDYDLVLTTYATMRNDVEFLKDFRFHYLILDESQNIKNPISQTAKAASILQSNHRLVLTGTPVENNTMELWSQFSFLNPGMLGSLHYFRTAFTLPIERFGDEESAGLLKKMISPFLLRRTKEQVARELPSKNEQIFYCPMEGAQKKLYEQMRDHYRAEIMNLISDVGMDKSRFKVLQGLTKLRQIACHPALIEEGGKVESGKFEAFMELVREVVAEGHKILVFSQFVRMLKIMAAQLKSEGFLFEMLTGQTRNREACVGRFQEDPRIKIFLISLKAGGLGLNLTAADYVILYDPWWNPATERQAVDRAHRIGQDKSVFVYKMIAHETVEEKILELQKRKDALVSQIISADTGLFKHLTADDIRGLFS
ncbi:MAG: SNF2-related protein [bacterium]